ncbi:MAG: helicase-related protein, partial [Armatimonadota bacterium]|nr:helicase-related protein [Armatimonadota bacterium]
RFLPTAGAVIVDEIHAIAPDKLGAHLALSLERLDRLAGRRLQRIGLSATVRPVEEVAQLLVGSDGRCQIVDAGHRRRWDLSVWVPSQPLGPVATHELRGEVLDRIARLAGEHRTTLVFVNTRRMAERVAHLLTQRLGEGKVAAHHGSLSLRMRRAAESGLRSGEVPVVVATASLELGIDIGHVNLVCHIGAPRAISTMLQRVGRSGHGVLGTPKGVLFPLTRDELIQCAACVRAAREGELDRIVLPPGPLDVLAQQIVAECAAGEMREAELWEMVRRAHPYRSLRRDDFEDVLEVLADGVATSRGRRGAWLHRDRVHGIVRGRRGARLAAITCGGAIPDVADYDVVEDPTETFLGKVNEDFAVESMEGDVFLLGNASWRIRRVESGRVRVVDAGGQPPSVPFWLGEAPARTPELSEAVAAVRERVEAGLVDREATIAWLQADCGVDRGGAEQIVEYVGQTQLALGRVPTGRRVVAERFFDEAGGMQLVVHAPFGARINRAWGLALRKRFCVTFDFELQAAATDDGIVLSLGEQHSFPLDSVFAFVRPHNLLDSLTQSVLQHPVFGTRFRQNAQRSLALLRFERGRRVPMPIQRMRSEDLLASVFPEQVACQDNRPPGPITPPDHPLVTETLRDCLHGWMDTEGLRTILERIEAGEIEAVAVETPRPSPMSHEILNANPYAFLDEAPLEERRARAVALRRTDPELARGAGALDPVAIETVRAQVWPDVRDADELHDFLLSVVLLPISEAGAWEGLAQRLVSDRRATVASWAAPSGTLMRAYVAAERLESTRRALGDVRIEPTVVAPPLRRSRAEPTREEALRCIVGGWAQHLGPVTVPDLARRLGLDPSEVACAMVALESLGAVLRGTFTPGAGAEEWCDRRVLARIHRLTVATLRREVEPVCATDFVRFLLRWQHVQPGTQLHGREGLAQVIRQLQGLELPAPAWESWVFPARVAGYSPADLETLCLSGVVAWGRLTGGDEEAGQTNGIDRRPVPTRSTPIAFMLREHIPLILPPRGADPDVRCLSGAAQEVVRFLSTHGASFFTDIVRGCGLLAAEVEDALWECVCAGLVTGDGVAGLRVLLGQAARARQRTRNLRAVPTRFSAAFGRYVPTGRWGLWRPPDEMVTPQRRHEAMAQHLLVRYGVVFRELCARERCAPPWRVLVDIYRRWEAQQRIRGGRFVSGFAGEQFALPEALEALRAVRRAPAEREVVVVSAADPTNLVGVVLPGERVPARSGLVVAYRNGAVCDVGTLGAVRSRLLADIVGATRADGLRHRPYP